MDRATFESTYSSVSGTFATNTIRDISEGDLRQFAQDISDSATFPEDLASEVTSVTVEVNAAAITSSYTTPYEVIAAPGANKIIQLIGSPVFNYIYGVEAFATYTNFYLDINGTRITDIVSNLLGQTADAISLANPNAYANVAASDMANKAVKFRAQTGDPVSASSTSKVYCHITYKVITLGT